MAVSIDTVYQKVLAFANKEQRGYITPQEFNLFADQAQMEIFEQYFYDEEQFERRVGSDIVELLEHKISIFKKAPVQIVHGFNLPPDTHQIDDVWIKWDNEKRSIVERVNRHEVMGIKSGSLLRTPLAPCYYVYGNTVYFIDNIQNGNFYINLIRKPISPNWGYVVVNDKPLYNSSTSTDFELHLAEESELVYRILAFSGIAIEKPQLTQAAVGLETAKIQQEKQ